MSNKKEEGLRNGNKSWVSGVQESRVVTRGLEDIKRGSSRGGTENLRF